MKELNTECIFSILRPSYLMGVMRSAHLLERIQKELKKKTSLNRTLFYLTFDSLLIALSMYVAFYLRFEGKIPENFIEGMGIFILLALSVKVFSLYYTGLYKVS
ncbi:hypothetical protein KJ656_12110, partial [bacterium]|nr:hypothetical protein [bacterium]